MKIVVTQIIDNLPVVRGFKNRTVDPETTRLVVVEKMKQTPEFQAVDELNQQLSELHKQLAYHAKEPEHRAEIKAEIEKVSVQVRENLVPLAAKKTELTQENLHYINPPAKDVLLDGAELEALMSAAKNLAKDEKLLTDGSVVKDTRGKFFWTKVKDKWIRARVRILGFEMPKGSAFLEDLKEMDRQEATAQYRADPIGTLHHDDKLIEYETRKKVIDKKAADLKAALNRNGDPEADQKTTEFVNTSMGALTKLFGETKG